MNRGYVIMILKFIQHNEGKFMVVECFIGTVKDKFCEYMTIVSKNVYKLTKILVKKME